MALPQRLIKYFVENKDKSKDEAIKEIIKKFGYAESSAIMYYKCRNSNVTITIRDKKEKTFEFFKENPSILYDCENEKYAKLLGIATVTYTNYKSEYIALYPIQTDIRKDVDKYYKGKVRRKFTFDDSKLFK